MSQVITEMTWQVPPAVAKVQWQAKMFAERPRRMELQSLEPLWSQRTISIAIHRNHPFEFIAQAMPPFLAYAGLEGRFVYSDYDDSLQFGGLSADMHLVWLDFETYRGRLAASELAAWLLQRLRQLRSLSSAPILTANWPAFDDIAATFNDALAAGVMSLPGCRVYDRGPLINQLGDDYWDPRLQAVGSTALSGSASVQIARDLGLRWIPAALRPRLKAVTVDLDNTLYAGVLGEDGIQGVVLTTAHEALQRRLLELRSEGLFLAAVSKNEAEDVDRLFAQRTDFPLRREHFSAMAVSWNSKVDGLATIAKALRISPDAIAFVDDNLGEIAEVANSYRELRCVYSADPVWALKELTIGPDLLAWSESAADRLRIDDLRADADRSKSLAEAGDPFAYLEAMSTRLDFHLDPTEQVARIYELSKKTNQFNLALKRLNEAEVAGWLAAEGPRAVTIRLSDKLSDSGIIGMMLVRLDDGVLFVEELCISCRALGRKLESLMIMTALMGAIGGRACRKVAFAHATGPRNAPARKWLAEFAAGDIREDSGYCYVDTSRLEGTERQGGRSIEITWH